MKRVTFFNEKGGTGKTLYNLLFASWLKYEQGERVFVQDFDYPSYQFYKLRQRETELVKTDERFARFITLPPYPIGKVKGKDEYTTEELQGIVKGIRETSEGDGYLIMDFPGRFRPNDPIYVLATEGLLDYIFFPIDSDRQSIASALLVNSTLNNKLVLKKMGKERQNTLAIWNKETRAERRGTRDYYGETTEILQMAGLPVCGVRGQDCVSFRRDGDVFGFVRSTLCYPKTNINMRAPWLEPMFKELKARIDETWALPVQDNNQKTQ